MAYDSFEITDYEHFRRRSGTDAQFFLDQLELQIASSIDQDQRKRTRDLFDYWDKWHKLTSNHEDEELEVKERLGWRKALAQQRFVDEYTRFSTADKAGRLLELGYSPEVTFFGYTTSAAGTEFHDLNWSTTLRRFKETINEGHEFPLRTPAFSLTKDGIIFATLPTSEGLKALETYYRLDQLRLLLETWGASLWECDLAASGPAECPECHKTFERTKTTRKFCGPVCRNRSKARRYRDKNRKKVDAARARYYT